MQNEVVWGIFINWVNYRDLNFQNVQVCACHLCTTRVNPTTLRPLVQLKNKSMINRFFSLNDYNLSFRLQHNLTSKKNLDLDLCWVQWPLHILSTFTITFSFFPVQSTAMIHDLLNSSSSSLLQPLSFFPTRSSFSADFLSHVSTSWTFQRTSSAGDSDDFSLFNLEYKLSEIKKILT